jgi:hypothetical protein
MPAVWGGSIPHLPHFRCLFVTDPGSAPRAILALSTHSFTDILPQSMSEATENQPLLANEGSQVKLVSWEGKEDQQNPRCFPTRQKNLILFILFSVTIISYIRLHSWTES